MNQKQLFCEICFDNFDNKSIKLFCCSKLICNECVESIMNTGSSKCPWCMRKWNSRFFYNKCEIISNKYNNINDCDYDDNTANARLGSLYTAGELRKEYEAIIQKEKEKNLVQIEIDESMAVQLDKENITTQKELEIKRILEEKDLEMAYSLMKQEKSIGLVRSKQIKNRSISNSNTSTNKNSIMFAFTKQQNNSILQPYNNNNFNNNNIIKEEDYFQSSQSNNKELVDISNNDDDDIWLTSRYKSIISNNNKSNNKKSNNNNSNNNINNINNKKKQMKLIYSNNSTKVESFFKNGTMK
jgi:hypothetical protein